MEARTLPSHPSLAAQLGQLCVVGFAGTAPSDPGVRRLRALACSGQVGGAIFFSHNIDSPQQVRALIGEMRSWPCPQPLWLMLDQEGGQVQRLRPERGFVGGPSAKEAGAWPEGRAQAAFNDVAAEVASLGFNANLAPVVDLHFNASPAIGRLHRAFGEDPADIVRPATLWVEAHRQRHVATALKHFPGHGSALGDTHHGFTDVSRRHQPREIEPFFQLIKSGHADMVMTSHLVCSPLTGNFAPITLSRQGIFGTLRQRMGYDGVIISDDLFMGALQDIAGGMPEVVVGALASGHDLLVVSGNRAARKAGSPAFADDAAETIGTLTQSIAQGLTSGRLNPEELTRSCQRVQDLKQSTASLAPQSLHAPT